VYCFLYYLTPEEIGVEILCIRHYPHEQDWERYVALGTLCIAPGQDIDILGFVGTTAKTMEFQSLWDAPTLQVTAETKGLNI
jgi:hypothetical protein